jgi:hypothetical protein
MPSEHFFSELPVLDEFPSVTDLGCYSELPDNWHVVVADIQNSTGAIQSGMYKAVNILGVSVISSILNAAKPVSIPYIFGGDGATLCIPDNLKPQAQQALITTRLLADKEYQLHLRVGMVPVSIIKQAGHKILVARHRMSRFFIQAAFAGGGVEYAEKLIKDNINGSLYRLEKNELDTMADFSGLECRWDNVPSPRGETIALIIKAIAPAIEEEALIYSDIIKNVHEIYGDDDQCRPVSVDGLRMTYNGKKLCHETKVRTYGLGKKAYLLHWLQIRIQNVLGWIFMTFDMHVGGVPWGNYKSDLVRNTDFKKFDGVLREVLSGTTAQREQLTDYLEDLFKNRKCVYGIHASSSALITCLINNRDGDHFHFIDGADGGYAIAATRMKQQLKDLRSKQSSDI